MPGLSERAKRVRVVNANYQAPMTPRAPGTFELLIVTEDDERHVLQPHAEDVPGLLSLIDDKHVLIWDPAEQILVAANVLGDWLPPDWSTSSKDTGPPAPEASHP